MGEHEKIKITRRLDVLDGLRGVAMLMVFFNHIDSSFIVHAFPVLLQQYVSFFFLSGKLGISFFFILSGFLMAYLYVNPVPREFIERRYARIFPPFIVMVLSMSIFRLIPSLSLLPRIALMLGIAFLTRLIWIHVIEKYKKGSLLITLFLLFQGGVALWYGFFIMRKPPIWFGSLPYVLQQATITATNATLTLPLGDYIPMIDGVYWSLIPEMIFYLIYPYLFVPTIAKLKAKSSSFISLFCISLFPFFFGTSLLFKHVRNFGMLFIEYFIYFCVGIGVAVLAKKRQDIRLPAILKKWCNPACLFLLLLVTHLNLTNTQGNVNLIYRLIWSVPFGIIVYSLLDSSTSLSRFFSKKRLVFLGTISYSMYISHTAIVDGMHLLFRPTDITSNLLFLVITTVVFLCISYCLHVIVETPYFMFKPAKRNEVKTSNHAKLPTILFLFFFLFIFFSSYTSQFNFFSAEYAYDKKNILKQDTKENILLSETPLSFTFISKENNMGIVAFHLEYVSLPKPLGYVPSKQKGKVLIRIRREGESEWYAEQSVSPAEIGKSSLYPFGFPPIADSLARRYEVSLSVSGANAYDQVYLHTDPFLFSAVHQLDKKTLLTHPLQLVHHFAVKVNTILHNREAFIVAFSIMPTLLLLCIIAFLL